MALSISLQFPTGKYVAAAWHDKESVEWPPHPARFCLGLLDALHLAGNPLDERKALEWLCHQGAPEIAIPDIENNTLVMKGIFVPQNALPNNSIKHTRKERAFPTVFLDPDAATVFFHWGDATSNEEIRASLGSLLRRLTRFGHSSSFVIASLGLHINPDQSWTILEPLDANDDYHAGDYSLRVPWEKLISSAETSYDQAGRIKEKEALIKSAAPPQPNRQLRPSATARPRHDPVHRWVRYAEKSKPLNGTGAWDPGIVIFNQETGNRLGVQSSWQITEVFHKTLLDRWSREPSNGPIPSWLSGHNEGTAGIARHTHLAIFPLPFVGRKHADGHLLGIGLALPKPELIGIERTQFRLEWRRALSALLEDGKLKLVAGDRSWEAVFSPPSSPKPPLTLLPQRWTKQSHSWQSVTPIILHRHPKPHFRKDPVKWRERCREIIAECCGQSGLPEPLHVEPSVTSPLPGVPAASCFPAPNRRPNRPSRFHIHARVVFSEPVNGPLLLGAGRYRGYGLFLPVDQNSQFHE